MTNWRTVIGAWQNPYWVHLGKEAGDQFGDHGGVATVSAPSGGFERERWYYLTTVRASGSCSLYIDGERKAHAQGTPPAGPGTHSVMLGVKHDMHHAWIGELDDVAYWRRGLTGHEVRLLYQSRLRPSGSSCGGYRCWMKKTMSKAAKASNIWQAVWGPTIPHPGVCSCCGPW